MTLIAKTAIDHVSHSLAGASELGALSILNQAGRHIVSIRAWKWLVGAKATLDTVSGNEYITLPTDFKRLVAIEQTNSLVGTFEFVPSRKFLEYKTSTITTSPISYWGTIVFARPLYTVAGTERPGAPVPRIELYPTPTSSSVGAFTMYYDRGWDEIVEDNQEVSIPSYMENIYIAAVRAFALGYEEEDTATVNRRLAELGSKVSGSLLATAIKEDSQVQPNYGQLRGGIADRDTALYRWSGATITGP